MKATTLLIFWALCTQGYAQTTGTNPDEDKGFAAKGTHAFGIGLTVLPTALNTSYHAFVANRVSVGLELNVGRVYTTRPIGDYYYRMFVQPGVKCNLHILKHSIFDPYVSFGIHAPFYATPKKESEDLLYDFRPGYISLGFGGRLWLGKHIGLFNEYALGNGIIKFGLVIKD